jgi:hypothetical protein
VAGPEAEKRSVTEVEADEVDASLKFATATVDRATARGTSDRATGGEWPADRGGDFNHPTVLSTLVSGREIRSPRLGWGF